MSSSFTRTALLITIIKICVTNVYATPAPCMPLEVTAPDPFDVDADDNCQADIDFQPDISNCDAGGITFTCIPAMDTTVTGVGNTNINCTSDDGAGNTYDSSTTMTVNDVTPPTITDVPEDINTTTTPDLCSASFNFIVSASDNCVASVPIQCDIDPVEPFPVGVTENECTATDEAGNESSDSFTVTVTDEQDPDATCQNINIELDSNGNVQIDENDIDNNSTDNCGIDSLSINKSEFTCDNVDVDSNVTLTVVDVHGNQDTCESTVSVEDNIDPEAICHESITVQLNESGNFEIDVNDIDNGSDDACGIEDLSIDKLSFDCDDIGTNIITLTVTDVNGNENTCQSIVIVERAAICPTDNPTKYPTNNPTTYPTKNPTKDSHENQSKEGSNSNSQSNEEDFSANNALFEHLDVNVEDKKDIGNANTFLSILVLFFCIVMVINLCGKYMNEQKTLESDSLPEITIAKSFSS